ncbi:MAG: exo-alpha-sialidase [Pirellulales bacterium]|nr:exo-alpha-sialidase [Pirellulales bacterium]
MIRYRFSASLILLFLVAAAKSAGPDSSKVPGVVVYNSPASSKIYLGSPGIAILPDGAYLMKCDEFGPGSTEHERAVSRVFRSDDRGASWRQIARIDGLFWANLFPYHDAVYLMGTEKHHGRIVIMRSADGGSIWSTPEDARHGLLTDSGEYHTAPMPMVFHNGRIWRAFEDAMGGTLWGSRYRAMMMSVPIDTDLMNQANWTRSNPLPGDPGWLNGTFGGWLEGNAIVNPDGEVINLLRVACPEGGKAAIVRVSQDGKTVHFNSKEDMIDFPGGAKKFTIRFDPRTKAYWTLANPVLPQHAGQAKASSIRNTLALICSFDLRTWEIRCILLYHPEIRHHGFQYPDWLFDGEDLVAAIRTAYDDGLGGAHNAHDANFLTFHRFTNFRALTMADSAK